MSLGVLVMEICGWAAFAVFCAGLAMGHAYWPAFAIAVFLVYASRQYARD
jgi:hypothetical protein